MAAGKGPKRDSAKERFWREVVAGQAKSRLSVRAWCLQQAVSEASFYAWRREMARRGDQAWELPRFAEVVIADRGELSASAVNEGLLQIHLDDVRVEVPAGFDRETLREVLRALRGDVC